MRNVIECIIISIVMKKTEYKGNRNYVTVTCPEHGDFQVLARTHSSDSQACGCIKCTVKVGFSRSSYATVCPEGSYVYVMEISRGAERFIKIGLSKNPEERAVSIIREWLRSKCFIQRVLLRV